MLRWLIYLGWSPILITALAILGNVYNWPFWIITVVLVVVLVVGLVVAANGAGRRRLEHSSQRLRQLAGYFVRRFTGNSSLSIFAIIDRLFNIENPELWHWARSCDMVRRVFDTWCYSYIDRMESDVRARRIYLRGYLNELWMINNIYYEYIEQFQEIAGKAEIPPETIDQYNKLVAEYNAFSQDFRDNIAELRKVASTQIEPPSVKFAKEIPVAK